MSGLTVKLIREDVKYLQTQALMVGFHEDVRPLKGLAGELDWLLCGSLSHILLANKLRGFLGDVALLTTQGKVPASKIFLLGLGARADFSPDAMRSAARSAAGSALNAGLGSAAVEYFQSPGLPHDSGVAALYDGLIEGAAGRSLDVLLIASDPDAYDYISRVFKA